MSAGPSLYALVPDWQRTQRRYTAWWRGEGLVLWLTAPRDGCGEGAYPVSPPVDPVRLWTDPAVRVADAEREFAATWYGGEAHPRFDPQLGPGNLASFLGSEPRYSEQTVWFEPCIENPETHPPLEFDPGNRHFQTQMAILKAGIAAGRDRYPVTLPDLIENVDILVSLRGMENLLADMSDRPGWIERQTFVINRAWLRVFNLMRECIAEPGGSNHWGAFCLWGDGSTAKIQCDASAAFGPPHFRRFVTPALVEQCSWLDHALYHLDGTQCLCHLEELIAIDSLDAIQWTPQAGLPRGGDPRWYELYRRILAAGKSVQAVHVLAREVIPLLDAVGPRGMFITATAQNEEEGRRLAERVDAYRDPGS